MKMKTGDTENRYMNEAEDRWLREVVREAMRQRPHAPPSTECPDLAIIRKLAFQEEIDPVTAKAAVLHMAECFDCSRLASSYVSEYKKQRGDPSIE